MKNNQLLKQMNDRENIFFSLLNKIVKEYNLLLFYIRNIKPYKIIEISKLSSVPGDSEFLIQVTNKSYAYRLTAAKIIKEGYNLNDFNDYHAEIIKQAAQGKLLEFLKITEIEPKYKIITKRFDKELQEYLFMVETNSGQKFIRTTQELSRDKQVLKNLSFNDIYDIGYSQGAESILKEKMILLLKKTKVS